MPGTGASPRRCGRAVVKVKTAEEVQAIVKLANETEDSSGPGELRRTPLQGRHRAQRSRSVIVDLSGMKRILNINRQQRIAVVEPGVTYGELSAALAKEGLMPFHAAARRRPANRSWPSVLDMEPRLNALHQWNFIDPLRCTEVVWGDGNRMYTGEAGGSPMDLRSAVERREMAGERHRPDDARLLPAAHRIAGQHGYRHLGFAEVRSGHHGPQDVPRARPRKPRTSPISSTACSA